MTYYRKIKVTLDSIYKNKLSPIFTSIGNKAPMERLKKIYSILWGV